MKLGISQPPHSPIAELSLLVEVVPISSAWRVRPLLMNILKLQAMFLYSIYHQRAGKTDPFHMRWGSISRF